MVASSSHLMKRLLSRRSMTAPSRILHTNAAPASGEFVKVEGPPFDFESYPAIQQKQTAGGLHLQIDMPGLSKEDVEFTIVDNMLIIKGNGTNGFGDKDGNGRIFRAEFDLPTEKVYKIKAMKAVMNNGVLNAFLPNNIKDDESSMCSK